MRKIQKLINLFIFLTFFSTLKAENLPLPYDVLKVIDGVEIRQGGFGSSMFKDPKNKNRFYALTDRGPVSGNKNLKIFILPNYNPKIAHFELKENKIIKLKEIALKDNLNNNLTGLIPNKFGDTKEKPYDLNKKAIKKDFRGIDPEGLVVMDDGSFFVSDEYGPSIIHFSKDGLELERFSPYENDKRVSIVLPKELANRRANRGFEGLTLSTDKNNLVAIMQSSMQNPNKKTKNTNLTRIITINLKNKKISQYIYKQDSAHSSNSEIVAVSDNIFLVLERDKKQNKIYQISFKGASNLEEIQGKNLKQNDKLGLMIEENTLEEEVLNNGWKSLKQKGIKPVKKTLLINLNKHCKGKKFEALWLMDNHTLGVLNDDDFAISYKDGVLKQKKDISSLCIIKNLNFQ